MDAVYQCYKKNKQVEFVLDNFYKNGGDLVYLVSDAGNDFSYLKKRYEDKLIYRFNSEKTWCDRGGWVSKSQAIYWMVWFTEACRNLNSDYFILLEDDVYIRGDLNSIKLEYEISGPPNIGVNTYNSLLQKYIHEIDGRDIPIEFYGGSGGSIMNRSVISKGEFPYLIDKYYDDMVKLDQKPRFQDAMLTILFRLCGYRYGENKNFTEIPYNENWKNTSEIIVHQYEFEN